MTPLKKYGGQETGRPNNNRKKKIYENGDLEDPSGMYKFMTYQTKETI